MRRFFSPVFKCSARPISIEDHDFWIIFWREHDEHKRIEFNWIELNEKSSNSKYCCIVTWLHLGAPIRKKRHIVFGELWIKCKICRIENKKRNQQTNTEWNERITPKRNKNSTRENNEVLQISRNVKHMKKIKEKNHLIMSKPSANQNKRSEKKSKIVEKQLMHYYGSDGITHTHGRTMNWTKQNNSNSSMNRKTIYWNRSDRKDTHVQQRTWIDCFRFNFYFMC